MAPRVESFKDFSLLYEENDNETGRFTGTGFAVVDDEDAVYFGKLPARKLRISMAEYSNALERIPDDHLYPLFPTDTEITVASPSMATESFYIKRPKLLFYEDYLAQDAISVFPELLLSEALVTEAVSKHPHPNIVRYHGCRTFRGRLTGIVLDRYEYSVYQLLKDGVGTVEKEAFMSALESAVRHLHEAGFAHNDINPMNIMVGRDDLPVLVDFGSCRGLGEKMGPSKGTRGWVNEKEDYAVSAARHDLHGLEKVRDWLESPTFNM